MTIGQPPQNDLWHEIMRALGGLVRVPIAIGMILVGFFMLWWLVVLIKAAARFVSGHRGG